MASFTEGDVVKLKSGGPLMTVQGVLGGEISQAACIWFDESNELHHRSFLIESLEKVSVESLT